MAVGRFRGDEATLAGALDIPIGAVIVTELVVSLLGAWWLFMWIPVRSRVAASTGGALALGIGWWSVFAFGPLLGLPI